MGKGQGSSRRTRWVGAFVVGLMLALAVPSIALASPVAFFQNALPTPGSTTVAASRMLAVTVYDRYGVRYMSNMTMSLDGVKVAPTWKPWAGYGYRKFTLKYAALNMAAGTHTVAVRIHDRANHTVNYSWSFTVAPVVSDTVPPVTLASGALPIYPGFAALSLAATDAGSGVAHTYWKFDGGPQMEGLSVQVQLAVGSHTVEYWSVDKAGNVESHKTLSTVVVSGILHKNPTGAKSSACTSCHGTNLAVTHAAVGCICHTASFMTAEMAPFLVSGATAAECVDCHKGQYAAHGFGGNASGHNTTTYGTVGAYTKWDGSEGVVVKDSANATITQEWPLPTADVFWSQSNLGSTSVTDSPAVAMGSLASAVRTDVGWGSVITCQDCHTNLSGALGPQGANAGQFGLDPRFPDDWTLAEITTFDPTGMRSILTTAGSPNPYYDKSTSAPAGNGYSSGDVVIRTICQKCHKLTNYKQGEPAQTRAGRSKLDMGLSNEAHMEHHGDQILGQANCVGCHIAIPHGWKRPRLLVYSNDPAPYVAAQPTSQTVVAAPVGSGLPSGLKGNWIYGVSTAGTSQHLDALNANAEWTKEATSGPAASGWDQSVHGIEWAAPGAEAVQTNCNACTATGNTHTPASEGVPVGEPTWK